MSFGADMPKAQTPAQRPERVVETEPEDITLGDVAEDMETDDKKRGKRSLIRPTGGAFTASGEGTGASGLNVLFSL